MTAPREKLTFDREAAFRAALVNLLALHGAEMTITDDRKPWGLHSAIVEIDMPEQYGPAGEVTGEYTSFTL